MEFTTMEIEKISGYSYVSKYIYRDVSLSLKAKGLLSLLFSLPDNWEFSEAGLAAINSDGVDSIKSTIKELTSKEYLLISRERRSNGQVGKSIYKFFQAPYSIDRESIENNFIELPTNEENTNVRIEEIPVTIISNYHLRDKKLSLKAKGLLSLMFSLPPAWTFSEKGLSTLNKDGVDSVRSAISELKENGYLVVEKHRDEKGRLGKSIYTFYRMPHEMPRVSPKVENPSMDNPPQENPRLDLSRQEVPLQEKPRQIKTNIIKTNISNTQLSSSENNKINTKVNTRTIIEQKKRKIDDNEAIKSLLSDPAVDQSLLETFIVLMGSIYNLDLEIITKGKNEYNKQLLISKFEKLTASDMKILLNRVEESSPIVPSLYMLSLIYNGFQTDKKQEQAKTEPLSCKPSYDLDEFTEKTMKRKIVYERKNK